MAAPQLYRKKPVQVWVLRWTGDNTDALKSFTKGQFEAINASEISDDPDATGQVFDSLHNTWILVYTGDWIIRGVKGEFYPCRPDVFLATYEAA